MRLPWQFRSLLVTALSRCLGFLACSRQQSRAVFFWEEIRMPYDIRVDQTHDVVAAAPLLSSYVLVQVGAAATLSGYFVDMTGAQASAAQSFAVGSSAAT